MGVRLNITVLGQNHDVIAMFLAGGVICAVVNGDGPDKISYVGTQRSKAELEPSKSKDEHHSQRGTDTRCVGRDRSVRRCRGCFDEVKTAVIHCLTHKHQSRSFGFRSKDQNQPTVYRWGPERERQTT